MNELTGLIDASGRTPTLPHPCPSQGQHTTLPPQPLRCQPVPHEQILHVPPPKNSNNTLTLDSRQIGSIPHPSGLSQKNLRAEMKLDTTEDAKAYYNKIRRVVRGHMSDHFWMDWAKVADNQKKALFRKVYNDPRIPIIQRYDNHWATDEIAKTIASGRRKDAYASGDATPPAKYSYNAANSSKRDPKAPRGRWNSMSGSVNQEGKGKEARRTEERAQDLRLGDMPEPPEPEPANPDAHTTNNLSLSRTTPSRPQDSGTNQYMDPSATTSATLRPNDTTPMYHSFQLSPLTSNDDTVAALQFQPKDQQCDHTCDEPSIPLGAQHTLRFLPPPLPMDNLYTFGTQNKHSEDEDDLYGFEN